MDFSVYAFMFPVCIVIATIAMASGISGAALLSPTIIIGFPVLGAPTLAPATAIGSSLFTEFSGFGSGVIGYVRRRLVDFRTARALVIVAVPVAAAAGFLSSEIDPRALKGAYGLLMLALAAVLWRQAAEELRPGSRDPKPRYARVRDRDRELTRIVDSEGKVYEWHTCNRRVGRLLTAGGAAMAGLISTGIGEIEMPQLVKRCHVPVPVAAATSIVIVALTVLGASVAHFLRLLQEGGVDAIPWNLIVYTVPGAIIGGQIGARLQGKVPPRTMERSMAILFLLIGLVFLVNVTVAQGLTT
jgi:uncharacterized membrane protein YfcA